MVRLREGGNVRVGEDGSNLYHLWFHLLYWLWEEASEWGYRMKSKVWHAGWLTVKQRGHTNKPAMHYIHFTNTQRTFSSCHIKHGRPLFLFTCPFVFHASSQLPCASCSLTFSNPSLYTRQAYLLPCIGILNTPQDASEQAKAARLTALWLSI